jgi:6-pyruvoyltetrahydropterin/6-carboxytetrahydropterin synthase
MPFQILAIAEFSASHQLKLYDGSLEPVHGHNWRVEVTIEAPKLDAIGVVMDFHELERRLRAITAPMHNRHLNELPAFNPDTTLNPTAEHVALHIAQNLKLPSQARLIGVAVWEAPGCCAIFRP